MLGKIVSPRLEKLEKEFLESGGEWKEVRVEKIFTAKNGDFDIQQKHINNKGEFIITSGLQNNGILGKSDIKAKIFDRNTITVDMFGNAFFRNYKYKLVTHARVFSLDSKNFMMNEKIGLYFVSQFAYFSKIFSYSNMCSYNKIKDLKITLPFLNGEIYFSYMEKYIEELEAYLMASGLKNYHLTKYDEKVLDKFNELYENAPETRDQRPETRDQTARIDRFILENLFSAETGDIDLQQSDINDRGTYFINSGLQNNRIKGKTDKPAKIFPSNTITIDFWGNAFYRNFDYKMATHNHVFSLSDASIKNEQVGLYLVSSMRYLSKIYSYNDMGTWNKMKKLEIEVPILNDEIDYKFMKDFIYAIEKLVIKDVVIWADKKI